MKKEWDEASNIIFHLASPLEINKRSLILMLRIIIIMYDSEFFLRECVFVKYKRVK